MIKVIPLILSFQLLIVPFGETLKCYECRSGRNEDCYNPTNASVNDCKYSIYTNHYTNTDYKCITYYERALRTNSTRIYRQCADYDICTNYKGHHRQGYVVDECYSCSEDLCNSGNKSHVGILLGTVIACVLLLKFDELFLV